MSPKSVPRQSSAFQEHFCSVVTQMVSSAKAANLLQPSPHAELKTQGGGKPLDALPVFTFCVIQPLLCGLEQASLPGLDYSMNLSRMLDALLLSRVLGDTSLCVVSCSREKLTEQRTAVQPRTQGLPTATLPTANPLGKQIFPMLDSITTQAPRD